jgi:hypothetical protein
MKVPLQLQEQQPLMVEEVLLMDSMRRAVHMVEVKQQMVLPPIPEVAEAPDTMTLYHATVELSYF